jgi:hypothetical protein
MSPTTLIHQISPTANVGEYGGSRPVSVKGNLNHVWSEYTHE